MSRTYAGFCLAEGENYIGMRAPAFLTIDPVEGGYSCRFMFFDDRPAPVLVLHRFEKLEDGIVFNGVSNDPRGWQVTWKLTVGADGVFGTYNQPYDHGQIQMRRIDGVV